MLIQASFLVHKLNSLFKNKKKNKQILAGFGGSEGKLGRIAPVNTYIRQRVNVLP